MTTIYASRFAEGKPDIADDAQDVIDDIRNNLAVLRDFLVWGAVRGGWDMEKRNTNGTPATDPGKPQEIVLFRAAVPGVRYRLRCFYVSGGAADGMLLQANLEYTGDDGANWYQYDRVIPTYNGNGTMTDLVWQV